MNPLRYFHERLINAIQAGRADDAYTYARLVAAIARTLQRIRSTRS